jgi:hypothetical protein
MNTDEHGLRHCEITQRIIGVFFQVYNELGMVFSNRCMWRPWVARCVNRASA